jgi:hypothetical protein
VLAPPAVLAGVTIGLDVAALNELVPAMAPRELQLPVAEDRSVSVILEDLQVTGLDPAAGAGAGGHILTSMRLRAPQLGLTLPLQPRVAVGVVEQAGKSLLELRFEQASVGLPLLGSVDLAAFLPPLRLPAENVFLLEATSGDVEVHSRLTGVSMGAKVLRFEFAVQTEERPAP